MNSSFQHHLSSVLTDTEKLQHRIVDIFEGSVTEDAIRDRINRGFERRDGLIVVQTFQKYAELSVTKVHHRRDDFGRFQHLRPHNFELAIPKEVFSDSLQSLGIFVNEEELKMIFNAADINDNQQIDFKEFLLALEARSSVMSWARGLPLADILVDTLPSTVFWKSEEIPLQSIAQLNEAQLKAIADGFSWGLSRLLAQSLGRLREAFLEMNRRAERHSRKPENDNKFEVLHEMRCGSIEDFHRGVEGQIGSPDLEFFKAMQREHCDKLGASTEFTSLNYDLCTTPKQEWEYVLSKWKDSRMAPKPLIPEHARFQRRLPDVDELLHLDITKKSNLHLEEVIAVVLYTGPMYFLYNVALRHWPSKEFKEMEKNKNLFTTTIFVLVSAVKKIAQAMTLPLGLKLYRGLGGNVYFPKSFYKADATGCRGFAEWGFMSTTSNREVALNYSGVKQHRKLPTVLEIRVGSVDRGACIREFSQYPSEVEYLWVPGSFIEPDGGPSIEVTKDGIVHIVPVQVNANLKGDTTEELQGRKKKIHITAFEYRILEIRAALLKMAQDQDADGRLLLDTSKKEHTVLGFVDKIVIQCNEVLARHNNVDTLVYLQDHVFRSLVLEMVEVKSMALSKMAEWLENTKNSLIAFRFSAPLRTVHRRYIAYKSKLLGITASEKQFLHLCSLLGLVTKEVDEMNELQETRLMAAAADGQSPAKLELLVKAGAELNRRRGDGVTAICLAAQFGYTDCIRKLVELKAEVNSLANNKASSVYMAAQMGNEDCIKVLIELKADPNLPDDKNVTPMHQAAMNGHTGCLKVLKDSGATFSIKNLDGKLPLDVASPDCKELLISFKEDKPSVPATSSNSIGPGSLHSKQLIISSGDVSDVDGFMAMAYYSKMGVDAVFVMNYPAYIGETQNDPNYEAEHPGLGYKYTAEQVLHAIEKGKHREYDDFMSRYDQLKPKEQLKAAMTDLAFDMLSNVWRETATEGGVAKGRCYFYVGGINLINPFSAKAIKNEVFVYAPVLDKIQQRLPNCDEGAVFDTQDGTQISCLDLSSYTDIYMDFNGSMAFMQPDSYWAKQLQDEHCSKVRGVFIMGGVQAHALPQTMPAIPGVLNRFSSATMNQLYHPKNTAFLFAWLAQRALEIPSFTITNNVVKDLATVGPVGGATFDCIDRFLKANRLDGEHLRKLARAHYESCYKPPRKVYDVYTAMALCTLLRRGVPSPTVGGSSPCDRLLTLSPRQLYYSGQYGLCLVSDEETWEAARDAYLSQADTSECDDDAPPLRAKKELFRREAELMRTFDLLPSVPVRDLSFTLNSESMVLELSFPQPAAQ